MSIKSIIEDNIVLVLAITAVGAFAAGWTAFGAVQSAAGRVSISEERLADLQRSFGVDEADLNRRIDELEAGNKALQAQLLRNRPTNGYAIKNIDLSQPMGSSFEVPESLTFTFEYVVPDGELVRPSITPSGYGRGYTFPTTTYLRGTGKHSYTMHFKHSGQIKSVSILLIDDDTDEVVSSVVVPVDYTLTMTKQN